jgi:hypothetical protein
MRPSVALRADRRTCHSSQKAAGAQPALVLAPGSWARRFEGGNGARCPHCLRRLGRVKGSHASRAAFGALDTASAVGRILQLRGTKDAPERGRVGAGEVGGSGRQEARW